MTRWLSKSFRKDSRSFQLGSIHKLSILIILACCFIILVTFLARFALDRVKEKIQTDVGDALQIVLQTTQESLNIWVESNKFQLTRLAEDPGLVSLTERQLRVSRNKSALLKSDALQELRAFFRLRKNQFGQAGFFIISPDLVNIGSMRDGNMGARNLIANQALDLLNRAFQGEALIVPPIWSDIPLITVLDGKNKMSPSMFFAAPIKNKQGSVIAVVTQRVDPSMNFSRLIQLGRIGNSGETYAFGLYGKLLSKSRFDEDLFKAGLLREGEKSILSVSVRDPGGDLTKGLIPSVPRYQQPLTLMAQQATKGKSGFNVEGYRDYRGVPVYGAWLWDAKLQIGLATEIDEAEALGPYYTTRTVILTVLGITVFLALGSLVFAVVIQERAGRALKKSNDELEIRVEERTAELQENQARLELAQERSRGLLDATKESLLLLDKEGIIIAINQTAARRYQQTPQEMIGINRFDALPQDLRESRKAYFSKVLHTGNPVDFEDLRAGMVFHNFYYPVQDKTGAIMGVAVFAQEITERKMAEEALKERVEELADMRLAMLNMMEDLSDAQAKAEEANAAARGLLDATQESLLLLDREGSIIAINQTAALRLQKTPAELAETNIFDLSSQKIPESRKAHFDKVLQTGTPVKFEDVREGAIFDSTYNPLQDKNGDNIGVAVFAQNITERKRAEEALRKSENNLHTIFENSPLGIVHHNKDGIIINCNDKYVELMGSSRDKLFGFDSLKHVTDEESHQSLRRALGGEKSAIEVVYTSATGSKTLPLRMFSNPTEPGNSPSEVISTLEDITERKQMEVELIRAKQAADDANKAKSDFLANMSHEIRTPMNAVIGMSHLALKTELTSKQKDYLNKIQTSANSLLGIINDILDFSKIEAGKLDMESVEFNLDDVLDNLANLVMVKAQEKENLEVLFATAREVPRFLLGDPLRLGQVLINLTNNAVKFTDSGEIVVSTELLKQDEAGLALKFSVRDTGIGLTEEQIGKLFQSFSQADTSTTRKFGGTGLGLTISKRLVNMMGGEIWVESKPGQGTNFSFTAKFGLGKEKAKKRLVPSSDMRGMKVLVVDDSATSRNILRDILESFSFEVTLAASGEEGLEDIQKADTDQPYELVLMDWKMPGLDGIEASRRIKNHQALSKLPAIILVTAYGREEIMQQAEQIGLEGFLIKPVSPSVLFDTIMQAFGEGIPKTSRILERNEESKDLQDIQGAQILLVEDNEINQQVAKEILAGGGLNVTVANDGQEAVDAVKDGYFDAILMDIQMPVMDGYAAAREIREWESVSANADSDVSKTRNIVAENPELKSQIESMPSVLSPQNSELDSQASNLQPPTSNIPIIAMTAHAMAGDEKKSIEAGMNDHVTKPIDPDKLFATLQNWIKPVSQRTAVQMPPVLDAPPDPDQMVPEEDELPESLPGFDLAAGLERLRGNKRLYRKLLLDFGANYGRAATEINEALEAKDFKQAHSLVHNLKGLAGNLEATNLQAAAVEMEKLVRGQTAKKTSDEELKQIFAELENATQQALDAVGALGPTADKKTIANNKEAIASVPPELIQKVTESIRTAADMGDVIQIKLIAEELKSESDAMAPFCNELVELAEDFDFDGIQKHIIELDS